MPTSPQPSIASVLEAAITKGYSDALANLAILKRLNTGSRVFKPRLIRLYSKLAENICNNYNWLGRSTVELSICPTAFHARNLLELFAWTMFCTDSVENAEHFIQDAMKDNLDMMKWLRKSMTGPDAEPKSVEAFQSLEKTMQEALQKMNLPNLDDKFTPTPAAAKKMGFALYPEMNKFFSKYAHPTALAVYLGNSRILRKLCPMMFVMGALYAKESYGVLNFSLVDKITALQKSPPTTEAKA